MSGGISPESGTERPESSEVTEPSRRIYAGLEIPPIRGLRHHEVQRDVRSARGMIVAEVWVTAEANATAGLSRMQFCQKNAGTINHDNVQPADKFMPQISLSSLKHAAYAPQAWRHMLEFARSF